MLRKLFTALAPLALGLAFAAPTAAQAADQVVRVGYQKKYGAFTLLKGRGTLEKKNWKRKAGKSAGPNSPAARNCWKRSTWARLISA